MKLVLLIHEQHIELIATEQALAAVEDLVEHRPRVGHRAADDAQDVGRGFRCSSASLVSLNRRVFSIAISAWSRYDSASAISLSLKPPAWLRNSIIAPTASRSPSTSRSSGTQSEARAPVSARIFTWRSGNATASQSGMCTVRFQAMACEGKLAAGSIGCGVVQSSFCGPAGVATALGT